MRATTVPVGTTAPAFALDGADGVRWRCAGVRGRALVLVFYRGHW